MLDFKDSPPTQDRIPASGIRIVRHVLESLGGDPDTGVPDPDTTPVGLAATPEGLDGTEAPRSGFGGALPDTGGPTARLLAFAAVLLGGETNYEAFRKASGMTPQQ